MAVRTDQVQLQIDFITDDSKRLAGAIKESRQLSDEIAKARKDITSYNVALKGTNITEEKRIELLGKVAAREKLVNDNLKKIAETGKQVEGLNLNNIAPAQLLERARQLQATMARIPQSAPEYARLRTELVAINGQMAQIRRNNAGGGSDGGGIFGNLPALAGRIGVIGAAVGTVVAALGPAVSGASKLEQLTISFETFLGSADLAQKVIKDLKDFEVKTPFEAEQVNNAGRALLAFGFSTEELIPTLTAVGDVAAGTGKDFNELALIYGKARASGLVQGDELNQLAEAGIPIYAELGKVLGVSESKIRKLGEEGKIQFADLEKVFKNLTSEGGRFSGLMERQSQSTAGLYSTLKSVFSGILTDLGTSLSPAIKGILNDLINLGNSIRPILGVAFDLLGKGVQAVMIPLRGLLMLSKDISDVFSAIGRGITGVFNGDFTAEARKKAEEAARLKQEYAARDRAESERDDRQLTPAEREALRLKEEERQAAQQKARDEAQKKREEAAKRAEAAFQRSLAQQEADTKAQELLLEARFITGRVKEREYQEELSKIQEEGLQRRLEVFKSFHRQNTNEALEAQNELLRIETARTERAATTPLASLNPANRPDLNVFQYSQAGASVEGGLVSEVYQPDGDIGGRLDVANAGEDAAQAALKQKFEAALIAEGEYNLRSLELKRALVAEEIAILRSATEPQVKEVEKREKEKADVEVKIQRQKEENIERGVQFRNKMEQIAYDTFNESINLSILLLSKDEAARKRHAAIIKAFQIGQVVTDGITEVQKIYAKYASTVGGILFATAEAAPAILRTTGAVVKIQRQQFAGGGDTGMGWGPADSTGRRPVGVVHEDEYVVPHWMKRIPEVSHSLGWMEGIRRRGYADGGFVNANTTPSNNLLPAFQPPSMTADFSALERAANLFLAAVSTMPTEVKARVVYTEIEDSGTLLNQVRGEASL